MVAASFVACKSKTDLDANKNVILVDTTGMYKSNMMTDTGSVIETTTLTNGNQNRAVANQRYTNTNRSTSTSNNRTSHVGSGSSSNTSNNNNTSSSTTTTRRKRGWSKAAKDATIGGVGGAVIGAVVSKNKVKGAVIGGVLGAGGGYILGRSKDRKSGRVQ